MKDSPLNTNVKILRPSKTFELKLHEVPPENFLPIGDRYVVELINVDERVLFESGLVATFQDPNLNPMDPRANPMIEQRGVIVAVVLRAGNGHLLGLPDPRIQQGEQVERYPADVPMFLEPGDVILIDRNSKGRALKHSDREIRIVNQIDCLMRLEGIKLIRNGNEWEQVEVDEVGQKRMQA